MLTISSVSNRINRLIDQRNTEQTQHIKFFDDGSIIIKMIDKDRIYVPNYTAKLFHDDDRSVRATMGPYGSGKSTLSIVEIVKRTCEMPYWHNGRRRARWAIVRNTSGELQTTTLKTWLDWFGDLGDVHKRQKPILTYEHVFNDGKGIVELELIFIALDRPEDIRKIKSLELTGCYFNELSEIPRAALVHMRGRVNRYPSHGLVDKYWSGIIADTNPPDEDHWIRDDFELKNLASYKMFRQPPGLIRIENGSYIANPDADNVTNLDSNYYIDLAEGQNRDFIKVFCLGEYGTVGFGKKVYPEFNPDFHSVSELQAIQGEPLLLGWDFGLTPACVVCQLTSRGQLLVLKEYVGEDIGIRSFAESVVLPKLLIDFPYNKVGVSVADPAGNHRSEVVEEMSCIGELNTLGINTNAARTNDIDPRLAAVRYFLNKMVDGKPAFILDRKNCPVLYKAFIKNYIYERLAVSGEEKYKDKPIKNMASHPMDALGYNCLELASENISKNKQTVKSIDMWNPTVS